MPLSTCSKVGLYIHSKKMILWASVNVHSGSLGKAGPCAVHTQTISGRITTHSCLHPLLHNTFEIYFRTLISVMLVYALTGLGDIILMDTQAALQREWWLYSAPHSTSVFKGNPLSTWTELVQAHMKIQVCEFWNPCSPSAFRDVEHLPSSKNQHFYRDIQCVISSGSHAVKLWPLAISWTKINLVSQPMPSK